MSSPSIVCPSKSALRPLSLEPLVPQQLSSRGHVMSALKKVVAVRVVRNTDRSPGSNKKYVVEVFAGQLRSRIPTAPNHGPAASQLTRSATSNQPASTIAKSLDDFVDLREQLCLVAHNAHEAEQCGFCRDMIEYAMYSNTQPNAVTRLFVDDEMMLQSLTKFVGDVLPMIESGCSVAPGSSVCRAQAKIPRLLHKFLFGQSSERS